MKTLAKITLFLLPLIWLSYLESERHPLTFKWLKGRAKVQAQALGRALTSPKENITSTKLPVFELRIKPARLRKLEEGIPHRYSRNYYDTHALPATHDYVDGVFWNGDSKLNVKVKYRGDNYFHWSKYKRSWRIKFPKDSLFHGQRKINLINPKFISQLENYLSYQFAERVGVLAPRSYFTHTRLNGNYLGLMLYVEQPDKYFLINHRLPESKIYFGDNATGFWKDATKWQMPGNAFRFQKEGDDRELMQLVSLLNADFDEEAYEKFERIVDIAAMARWHAYVQLIRTSHQDAIHNIKLIFDPSRGTFIPMAWDPVGFQRPAAHNVAYSANPLHARLFRYERYRSMKNQALYEMLSTFPLEDRIRLVKDTAALIHDDLLTDQLKEYRGKHGEPLRPLTMKKWREGVDEIKANIVSTDEDIRRQLNELEYEAIWASPSELHLRVKSHSGHELEQVMFHNKPNLDVYVSMNQESSKIDKDGYLLSPISLPTAVSIYGFQEGNHIGVPKFRSAYREIRLFLKDRNGRAFQKANNLKLVLRNQISGKKMTISDIQKSKTPVQAAPQVQVLRKPSEDRVVWSGVHKVLRDTVVDRHQVLHIAPGTDVLMSPGVTVTVLGRLDANGTEQRPIRFRRLPGEDRPWGSFAILSSPNRARNELSHCLFSGGSEGSYYFAKFTGALAVHHADVTISHCAFEKNFGEDNINLKYSNFLIDHVTVHDSSSDGIDLDFSLGTLTDTVVDLSKNDGIDLSYSKVTLSNTVMRRNGDKGISVGERSNVSVRSSEFLENQIGIEVKDESIALVKDSTFKKNVKMYNIYRKKNEFSNSGCLSLNDIKDVENGSSSVDALGTIRVNEPCKGPDPS